MDDEQAEFERHGVQTALPSSALPSRGFSGDDRRPRPNTAARDKTRRRPFVVPSRVRVPGQDLRDAALAGGSVLPPLHPHYQASVSTAAATKAPPPCGRVEDLRAGPAHLPSPSRYQVPPTSYAAAWDTRSSASTPPLGYEAAGDDRSPTRMPVFDWTPTPTPSTANNDSRGFMNMLTQDADPDMEVLMELSTPSSGSKGASKRGSNYNHDEDIQLCISWMNVSTDPVVRNDQPSKAYWSRIADHYNDNKTFGAERNANSLEHRWGVIQKEGMKFQGYFEEVERRNRSGIPYKEHLIQAQARYYGSTSKGRAFPYVHCWLKIRHCEKFISLNEAMKQAKRPSRSSTPSEGDEGGHDPTPDSSVPPVKRDRPPGRKQSKEKLKRREGGDEYMEVWGSFLQMKTEEHKQREARWNKSNQLQEHKLEIEERKLLWEQEQKIMFCDVSTMDDSQRAYVLAMRTQIAKEKVASLSSRSSATRNEHESGGDGDGDSCA